MFIMMPSCLSLVIYTSLLRDVFIPILWPCEVCKDFYRHTVLLTVIFIRFKFQIILRENVSYEKVHTGYQ